ncbi:hypothetical protein EYR38_006521 [Pleurotus pulmonarius]|nr:hypothetical protein EYR38_006521 [Pleurotus pulmonarius]
MPGKHSTFYSTCSSDYRGLPSDSTGKTRRLPPDEHPTFVDTWKDMEKLLDTGKVKTIGVSNFSVKTLTELLPHCTVIPAINQVQLHPCLPQVELKAFCEEKGIILTAYTPLGRAESRVLLEHETIVDISKSLGVTPAQVLLSWSVQKNIIVIPKSEDDERMQANINATSGERIYLALTMNTQVPSFQLNDGTKIPAVGMGCWLGQVGGGQRVFDMCTKALKNGYRHFDTASGYGKSNDASKVGTYNIDPVPLGNEKEVGQAINASRIPREEIYVTTKLPNDAHHRVRESFEESLQNLQCGYVDLYLMHWPFAVVTDSSGRTRTLRPDEHPTFIETWKEMEKLLDTGKVKTIGVSNFSVKTLTELLPHCTVTPATNQVELHPCLPQAELKVFCEEKGILLTAYTPLGRSKVLLEHETVGDIAKSLNVTPAQVLLSWSVQRGIIVVPKSEDDQRMQDNIKLVNLSDEAIERINKIHGEPGMHRSLLKYHSPEGGAFGWSYEDFGWNMVTGGIIPSK